MRIKRGITGNIFLLLDLNAVLLYLYTVIFWGEGAWIWIYKSG